MRFPKITMLAASLAVLAGCNAGKLAASATEANEANFTAAMQAYLARRGDLCVGRSQWPVVVTRGEAAQLTRNSVQLPVLEKLGLVASREVDVVLPSDGGQPGRHLPGRSYELTDRGRQYDLARPPRTNENGTQAAGHDLCTAKLSLRKVLRWDPPATAQGATHTVVTYTYDIAPAPWTADADVRRVFPMIDRMLRGAGTIELQEGMVLTAQGWQAQDL